MDGKAFLEVFPTLKLKDELREAVDGVVVSQIGSSKRRDKLNIYITADRVIGREDLADVEQVMCEQLFPDFKIDVNIIEHFDLSEQYTPEYLFKEYYESMLFELKKVSPVMYSMFHGAEVSFSDEHHILVKADDMLPFHSIEEDLIAYIKGVFEERCGIGVSVSIAYKAKERDDIDTLAERRIKRQIKEISSRIFVTEEVPGLADKEENGETAQDAPQEETVSAKVEGGAASSDESKNTKRKESTLEKFSKKGKSVTKRRSEDKDVIYGFHSMDGDLTKINELFDGMGDVYVHGEIVSMETRDITKRELVLCICVVTDYTDSIVVKFFIPKEESEEVLGKLKTGMFVKVFGNVNLDTFDHDIVISGRGLTIKKIPSFKTERMDDAPQKRVELHCHTKMSDMDGVSDVVAIMKRAYKWGHKAIAITDHGVVTALADVFHDWCDLWDAEQKRCKEEGIEADRQKFFKLILGVEGYLVDDLKQPVVNPKDYDLDEDYVVFDIETTGFSPIDNTIIEIGAVKVSHGEIVDRYSTFVNPKVPIPYRITQLTSIRDEDVMDAPTLDVVLPEFIKFCEGCLLVAHNAGFDTGFIKENCKRQGLPNPPTYLDTMVIARILLPNQGRHNLDALVKTFKITLANHHRAVEDAEATAEIFLRFLPMLEAKGVKKLQDINLLAKDNFDNIKRMRPNHIIILAKNEVGRINLYKLVSASHLKYFHGKPRIPKSLLMKYREGLILGSACEAGELFQSLLENRGDEEAYKIASFYDYLEIQPVANNRFMITSERIENINSDEDIRAINKKIIKIGEALHKPVVATCDAHFIDPEEEIYRSFIMSGKGMNDEYPSPLYIRTTEEMLEEFSYLGSDKAKEVVITNTNLIADCIESISPVRPDKSAPVIPHSDEMLTEICYNKAHEIYGPDLPEVVEKRLEKELHAIISNGFAVMYIIAQKLVWKSVEDGYLVGSRGSVGSSFVANMAGITEVNSLSAHYRCPNCFYYDFDSPEVKQYSGMAGCDMPDKICPKCGKPLVKDGFDIPFETFLGFKGDKEPDIDLNFSGEYQSKAHKYTEVIFGAGQTYRAGTIGTLAEKTAYGFVKKYFEERGIPKRGCEIDRLKNGIVGIRRSTGQHPGGIVVLPVGEEINSFTPVQHPANDMETDIVTTHFDYHKIDHNLLKLDILGHDDPTMIRMLQDLTGVDPVSIPLDDKDVMSLFQSTEALGVTPDQIRGCKLGSMGIPEFGTDFVIQMLLDTKPQCFTDLVRISGLSHGTDVWLNNAQTLIQEGKATISTAICTRDDIMVYLINKGLPEGDAFQIMENVRKGKVAKGKCKQWPAWSEMMREHDVPDWYIWSCEQIKYMFPKAHAAAYVMMAWRVAYFKVNYPLAYYASYFSIRASGFSYEKMCQGRTRMEAELDALLNPSEEDKAKKDDNILKDIRIVQEMYARGYEFMPIDLYRAHSRLFTIIDGKIMPSFNSIDGMGDKAAESLMEAAKNGPFLSKDDLCERGKISRTIADKMDEMGLLGDIPESNQISLFDFMGGSS
ncbi:MAG: PolC-type DNA polymerase III [Lachnospiraceae bacterium]|nr:PolC-type DNA polymerase III [Lachnospiraceae bacterium]